MKQPNRQIWFYPIIRPWESWGDSHPEAGVYGLMQPVMPPVFETQALGETLLSVATQADEAFSESLPSEKFFRVFTGVLERTARREW